MASWWHRHDQRGRGRCVLRRSCSRTGRAAGPRGVVGRPVRRAHPDGRWAEGAGCRKRATHSALAERETRLGYDIEVHGQLPRDDCDVIELWGTAQASAGRLGESHARSAPTNGRALPRHDPHGDRRGSGTRGRCTRDRSPLDPRCRDGRRSSGRRAAAIGRVRLRSTTDTSKDRWPVGGDHRGGCRSNRGQCSKRRAARADQVLPVQEGLLGVGPLMQVPLTSRYRRCGRRSCDWRCR